MQLNARLVALTQPVIEIPAASPEGLVAYCARVSSNNQDNPDTEKLLSYCIRNKHWSIFQIVNAVIEIEAPRDITRQFTRHSSLYCSRDPFDSPSFNFDQGGVQEFSQRYSDDIKFTERAVRRQDEKNRQNSIDDMPEYHTNLFNSRVNSVISTIGAYYKELRAYQIAKECARVILPEGLTMSKLYVNGTLRSWLHYLDVRDDPHVTQHEHVLLARKIKEVLIPAFPIVMRLANDK